jgi:cell wall-associated NlpC family hydrolase
VGRARDRPGNWDCSSFTSYVLGHDLGLALPGGRWGDSGFPPHSHGPTTHEYATFGAQISRAQVAAGDLVVWGDHHIGIAINNTTMISAQDQKLGTGTSSIDGASRYFGAPPSCRRVAS